MRQVRLLCLRAVSIWMIVILFLSAIGGATNQPVFAAPVEQEVQPTPSEPPGESIPAETSALIPIETSIPLPTETSTPVPTETGIPITTETDTPIPSETNVLGVIETSLPDPSETLSAFLTPDPSPTATMEVPVETLPDATLTLLVQTPQAADSTMKTQAFPGMIGSDASVINKIAAGSSHTCAMTTGGGVICWGYNDFGQLGDGTPNYRSTPVDVSALGSGVAAIATGSFHTCALTTDGGVKCWGENTYGQIGNGLSFNRYTPVDVSGLSSGVAAISAGGEHTCALTMSGGVKCWGYNGSGQLGDGTKTNRLTPVNVNGLNSGVVTIAAGSGYTCALTTAGMVKCWGGNYYGNLGDGTTTNRFTPVTVSGLSSGVAAIAGGGLHTCALTTGGGVKCWGRNNFGQLGDGTTNDPLTAVSVSRLGSGVAAIAAGGYHTCALTTGGAVKCWGYNEYGQLGDGTTNNRLTVVDVSGLSSGVVAIANGYYHTCALITGGAVKCWGENYFGQLGDGTNTYRYTPAYVIELGSGVAAINAGDYHTCALMTGGGVKCWGYNEYGQLGDGTTSDRLIPAFVLGFSPPDATSLISPSGSTNTKQPVFIWNSAPNATGYRLNVTNGSGEIVNQVFNAEQVECGSGAEQCALVLPSDLPDGNYTWKIQTLNSYGDGDWSSVLNFTIYTGSCWSVNLTASPMGWAGNPSVTNTSAKCNNGKFAPGETVQITPGTQTNYTFSEWSGELTGTGTEFSMPDRNAAVIAWYIRSDAPVINKIAAGYQHTCALTGGGEVICWGNNQYGQLGDDTTTNRLTPADVSGLSSGVSAITAGGGHTCALTTGGGVKCWGRNWYGQLGDGTTSDRYTPVDVSGLGSGVAAIATGDNHTCALTKSGMVKCWGYNQYGQLGDGTNTWHYTPVIISSLGNGITAITAGDNHTCVLTIGGAVKCWGQNDYGQLGDGTITNRLTPMDVSGLTSGMSAIAAGGYHTCALTTGGAVKCWGYNGYGQLGDGTTTNRWTAVGASGLSIGVSAIAAGYYHTCALITGGAVKCWGGNYYGQLGDGTNTYRYTPAYVIELGSGVAAITAGHEHTCALTTGGGVMCWGYNESGQLGDGTTSDRWTPVGVSGYASPDAANLISPSGGISTTQPTFIWNAVPDTTDYRLYVSNASGEIINQRFSAAQVNCDNGSGQCSLVAPSVLSDAKYHLKK